MQSETKGSEAVAERERIAAMAHSWPSDKVLAELNVDRESGLTDSEVRERRKRSGPNSIEASAGKSAWRILVGQFSSMIVWLLAAAAAIALFTGSPVEAAAILVVLLLNALIGFWIEWQAGRALEALRHASRTVARVQRNGRRVEMDAIGLVPGDIVELTSGDRVPADARLIESISLRSDESALTGESIPVSKLDTPAPEPAPLAERHSMVYLGTNIVAGHGLAVVTAVGSATEIGRIGTLIEKAETKQTPLEQRLDGLGRWLVYLVLVISAVVMVAGVARGDDLWLMAKVAISLAVAAVPEGLPAVTTLVLALGVLRMARASAIVRHLAAVETLGSTTVICTDKTGTLTENRMTVRKIILADGRTIRPGEEGHTEPVDLLGRLLRVGVLCSEATFHPGKREALGDPTETALLEAADRMGMDIQGERISHKRVFEIPFEAAAKKMTSVFEYDGGEKWALMKGAPSVVLEGCVNFAGPDDHLLDLGPEEAGRFLAVNNDLADEALRVLAFAEKRVSDPESEDLNSGFTFLGFVGMSDPPRGEVPEAIERTKAAGIKVVMLTGDQVLTARAVARELDLGSGGEVFALHSRDMREISDADLARAARKAHVFARVTPEDKFRIVKALQDAGEIVAVTGDGVNDAPALKQADIGIAMGLRGTDVAKEVADIVLTDDNFSTITRAVEGGRTIFANIIKFVHMMFSHNLAEILIIFGAIVLGFALPLLPLQILWVNLVTDIFPALALALEPPTKDTMRRGPRSPQASILSGRFMFLIVWQGVLLAAIVSAAYIWALGSYGEGAHARTVALTALVAVQLGHLLNCRSRSRSAFSGIFRNPYIFGAIGVVSALQLAALFFPPLAAVLELSALNGSDWAVIASAFVLPVAIVEFTKLATRKLRPAASTGTIGR